MAIITKLFIFKQRNGLRWEGSVVLVLLTPSPSLSSSQVKSHASIKYPIAIIIIMIISWCHAPPERKDGDVGCWAIAWWEVALLLPVTSPFSNEPSYSSLKLLDNLLQISSLLLHYIEYCKIFFIYCYFPSQSQPTSLNSTVWMTWRIRRGTCFQYRLTFFC